MPIRMDATQFQRRHKYGAVATTVHGIRFASKAEAKRYGELLLLARAGEISELTLQPRFPLFVRDRNLKMVKVATYIADFRYRLRSDGWPGNGYVVEDTKGFATPVYRLKKKMVEAQYGITITEVGSATRASKAKRAGTTRRSARAENERSS